MAAVLKTLACALACALVALIVVVAARTWLAPSRQMAVPALAPLVLDVDAAADRLAGAVRIPTVSVDGQPDAHAADLQALHAYLEANYPNVHRGLTREVVDAGSLLYTWRGRDSRARPMLLMAHQDVVPVAPGTERDWTEPPFGGVRRRGTVWGRGTWDDKGNLIAELEAVERLVADGFQPERTIYLAFGHDEEVLGRGAKATADLLKSRGVRLAFAIDEGLLISERVLPGLATPLALIGVAEKGYLSVRVTAHGTPGHSSIPPPPGTSATALLSRALTRIEEQPFPGVVRGVAREMLETIGPETGGALRVATANLWLLEPLVRRRLESVASSNAMLRTTTAITVLNAGGKENALPGVAEAIVNVRILPGDTTGSALAHVRQAVGDGPFDVTPVDPGSNPSPVSSSDSAAYRLISRTIREVFPGTLVAPGLMIGASDSRHYAAISDHIYRFSPLRAETPDDLSRLHGTNERISETNFADLIRFYHRLLSRGAGPDTGAR